MKVAVTAAVLAVLAALGLTLLFSGQDLDTVLVLFLFLGLAAGVIGIALLLLLGQRQELLRRASSAAIFFLVFFPIFFLALDALEPLGFRVHERALIEPAKDSVEKLAQALDDFKKTKGLYPRYLDTPPIGSWICTPYQGLLGRSGDRVSIRYESDWETYRFEITAGRGVWPTQRYSSETREWSSAD